MRPSRSEWNNHGGGWYQHKCLPVEIWREDQQWFSVYKSRKLGPYKSLANTIRGLNRNTPCRFRPH